MHQLRMKKTSAMHTFKITNSFRALFSQMHFFCTFWHPALFSLQAVEAFYMRVPRRIICQHSSRKKSRHDRIYQSHLGTQKVLNVLIFYTWSNFHSNFFFADTLFSSGSKSTVHYTVVWMHCRKQPRQLFADEINALQNSRIIQPFTPRLLFKVCAFWLKVK